MEMVGEKVKVLIIGGMGVIGGAITKASVSKGMAVHVVSRRALFDEWKELDITEIRGDWKDDEFANRVVADYYDVIVDTQIFNEKQLIRSLNIVNNHCKQFIYISTDSVYSHPADNLEESVDIKLSELKWKYGYDKRKAELFLLKEGSKYSFYWTVIRPTITFGNTRIPVGFSTKRNTYTLVERMIAGKPIVVFDEEKSYHAVCHVSIFGDAVVELFLQEKAANQFYHISDDKSYTYAEIFNAIEQVLGIKGKFVHAKTDWLKKYSKSSYEEMIFDKNPNFTLNNNKIKSIATHATFHVDMVDVMTSTLEHLKKVGGVDSDFNRINDCILLKLSRQIDNSYEQDIITEYIKGLPYEYIDSLKKYELKLSINNIVNFVKKLLRPIKHALIPK